jgi:hypothetical protein
MRDRNRSADHERDVESVQELLSGHTVGSALLDVISDAVVATKDDRSDQAHQLFGPLIQRPVFISLVIQRKKSLNPEVAAVQKFLVHLAAIEIKLIHWNYPFQRCSARYVLCPQEMYHRGGAV